MRSILRLTGVRRFLRRDDGATAVEYAVMVGLIITTCIAAISQLGGENGTLWSNSNDEISTHFSD